jgi:hypothetical protein
VVENHLPLLQNVLPIRFAIIAWMAIAFLVAAALEGAMQLPTPLAGGLVAFAVLGSLVPLLPAAAPAGVVPPVPSFFTTADVRTLPAGQVALVLPYPQIVENKVFLWQVASGMRFAQPGSYALRPTGPNRVATFSSSSPILAQLFGINSDGSHFSGALTPALRQEALAEIHADKVATVVVGPSTAFGAEDSLVTSLLGRPADRRLGGVELWSLQR